MAKKAVKKSAAKKVSGDPLVVKTKVKDFIKAKGKKSGDELIEALNAKVQEILLGAISRADANGRTTLRSQDL